MPECRNLILFMENRYDLKQMVILKQMHFDILGMPKLYMYGMSQVQIPTITDLINLQIISYVAACGSKEMLHKKYVL